MIKNINDIQIPDNLDSIVDVALKEVSRSHKRKTAKKIFGFSGTIFGLALAFFAVGSANPVWASGLPIIGGIFERVQGNSNFSEKAVDLATNQPETADSNGGELEPINLGLSSSDKGITLEAKEAYFDGYTLYITVKLTSENPLGKICEYYTDAESSSVAPLVYVEGSATVDGAYPEFLNLDSRNRTDGQFSNLSGIQVDDYTFEGMMSVRLANYNDEPISGGNLVEMDIYRISADISDQEVDVDSILPQLMVDGNWSISFTAPSVTDQIKCYSVDEKDEQTGFGVKNILKTDNKIVINSYKKGYDDDGYMSENYFHELFDETNSQATEKGPAVYEKIKKSPAFVPMVVCYTDIDGNKDVVREVFSRDVGTSTYFLTKGIDIKELRIYYMDEEDIDGYFKGMSDSNEEQISQKSISSFIVPLD